MATTFVLGAGFSVEQGFPLVWGLKERVIHFVEAERHPAHERFLMRDDNYDRGEFYAGLEYIDPANDMGYEEVLIALSRHLTEKSEDPCFSTRDILRVGAARLLWCIDYFNPRPEACYENFADHLKSLAGGAAVITFNWDILLERALTGTGARWTYSLSNDDDDAIAVIKPHGSLNWSSFRQDPKLVAKYQHWEPIAPGSTLSFDSADPLANPDLQDINSDLRYCLYPGDPDLPASHPDIARLWNDAVSAIRASETVVFVGYSLPAYDSFACDLFLLECAGKSIEVYDPSPAVNERFRAAFEAATVTRCTFNQSPYAQRRSAG